jgi:hypothetical protein
LGCSKLPSISTVPPSPSRANIPKNRELHLCNHVEVKMPQSWRKRSQGTGSQNWTHTKAFVFLLSIHLNTPSLAGYSSLLLRIARWTKWDFQPPWWMAENSPQMQSETAMTNQWQGHFQHYWGRKHQAVLVLKWMC